MGWQQLFEASPGTGCSGGAWVAAAFCSFCYCDPGGPAGNHSDSASAALETEHLVSCAVVAVVEVAAACVAVGPCVVDRCSHTLVPLYPHGRPQDPAVGDQYLGEHGPAPAVDAQQLGFLPPPV